MTTQPESTFQRVAAHVDGSTDGRHFDFGLHGISFYENEIPDFLASEMDVLYENIYSSVSKFQIDASVLNATTYVDRLDGRITAILVFRRIDRTIEVINECIKLGDTEIQKFADAVFARYPQVARITFHAVQASIAALRYPYQCHTCLEDIVLQLPASSDLYFDSLGKSTRQYISRYSKVAKRDLPSFQFKICPPEELTDALLLQIIEFSNARLAAKDRISLHNQENTRRLMRLIYRHGFVGMILIDGRVCAAAMCSRLGANYFLHVLSHDPKYDSYRLGTLCCYLTIDACIAQGGRLFHFLWGRFDYKFRLLGVQQDLQRVAVYRSYVQFFLNGTYAFKLAFKGMGRSAKSWLLEPGRRDWRISRFAIGLDERTRRLLSR